MKTFFIALIAVIAANAASAATVSFSGRVSEWRIDMVDDIGLAGAPACNAVVATSSGGEMRIGVNEDRSVELTMTNPHWRGIDPGAELDVAFSVDGRKPWVETLKAKMMKDGSVALVAPRAPSAILVQLANGRGLDAKFHGKPLTHASLRGGQRAINAARRC